MLEQMEKSCGAVVFTRVPDGIRYVIIRSRSGAYGFPKGHCEEGETEEDTALREIWEETGLRVRLLSDFRCADCYRLPQKPEWKQVVYFLAEYEDQEVCYRQVELSGASLYTYESAMEVLRWDSLKAILSNANDYLTKMEIDHV